MSIFATPVMAELLTVQEVARYLKVSRVTVWRWCTDGRLNAFKIGRGWRIQRSHLESFLIGQSSSTGVQFSDKERARSV